MHGPSGAGRGGPTARSAVPGLLSAQPGEQLSFLSVGTDGTEAFTGGNVGGGAGLSSPLIRAPNMGAGQKAKSPLTPWGHERPGRLAAMAHSRPGWC